MATLERREQTPGTVRYRVRWWAGDRQRSKTFTGHADAKRFKASLEGDLVNGTYIDPKEGAVTMRAFASEHLDTLTIDVRESTKQRILSVYRTHILPEFGDLPLTAISPVLIADWVGRMQQTLSAATVRKNVFILRRVLDLAVANGALRANSASLTRLPAEPHTEQKFLDYPQAIALADSIHPRFRAMVMVAVFGGLRFGEICGLARMHIIPERNQIAVKRTVVDINGKATFGEPKTKESIRTVTIPRSVMKQLVMHMDTYTQPAPDSLVFTGERGVVIRRHWFSRYYWAPAVTRCDLQGLRFHDLRHTFVSLWVSLGRNPKEVSRAAGHSSVAFTLDRYGHLYETDSNELADELDALLGHVRPHERMQSPSGHEPVTSPSSSRGLGHRPFGMTAESG